MVNRQPLPLMRGQLIPGNAETPWDAQGCCATALGLHCYTPSPPETECTEDQTLEWRNT